MKHCIHLLIVWFSLSNSFSPAVAQQLSLSVGPLNVRQHTQTLSVQQPETRFEFKAKKDLPILIGGTAMAVTGLVLKARVKPLTADQLANFDPADVNAFDRSAIDNIRDLDSNLSDYLLGVSALAPLSLLGSRAIRRESLAIAVMYLETGILTTGLTSLSKGLFKRERPYVYNPDALLKDRTKVSARHSFWSGHVSNSAAFMFLTASMVQRYAENPTLKLAAWSGAVVLPGTIALWRYTSGKHFPTDVLAGYVVGAGVGLLIPWMHRRQLPEDLSLQMNPTPYGMHLVLTF